MSSRCSNEEGFDNGVCRRVGVASGGPRGSPLGWRDATFADLWEPSASEGEQARPDGLPVPGENDANCAALGEYWTTGSSPMRDFVTVCMACGIGCGIVIGGSLYRGVPCDAGEIGPTLTDPNGAICWCTRRGCLDTVASPRACTQQILQEPTLVGACGVREQTELGEDYRRLIAGGLADSAFTRAVHPISVRLGAAGPDAAALGAASVVLHRQLTPHRPAWL